MGPQSAESQERTVVFSAFLPRSEAISVTDELFPRPRKTLSNGGKIEAGRAAYINNSSRVLFFPVRGDVFFRFSIQTTIQETFQFKPHQIKIVRNV